ncbi:MAG: hypothetical protein GY776_06990 [Alteromonas sp.]|nr:hypothetical protein [Alteromonas sp.]
MSDTQLQVRILEYRDRWIAKEINPTAIAKKLKTVRTYVQSVLSRSMVPVPERVTKALTERREDIERCFFDVREFTCLGATAPAVYAEMLRLDIRFPKVYKANKKENVLRFTEAYRFNLISAKDIGKLTSTSEGYIQSLFSKEGVVIYSEFRGTRKTLGEPDVPAPETRAPETKPKKLVLGIPVY